MNANHITSGLAAAIMVLAMSSCAENKFYDLGGGEGGLLNFKAVNLTTADGNETVSTIYDYWELPDINKVYPLEIYYPWEISDGKMHSTTREIQVDREHTIWTGGYNDIEITFLPSAPEEKSAVFTMPDGTTHTATVENPTFIWTPDSALYDNRIMAESKYTVGKTTYVKTGFIYLNVREDLRYNKDTDKWYFNNWFYGEPLTSVSYSRFTVENLTIASQDTCVSYNYRFPETVINRTNTFTIPYIGYGGQEHIEEITNSTSYYFYACGNNDLLFTFHPRNEEKELTLTLPDNTQVTLTVEKPSYVWHVDYGDLWNYDYRWITGTSTYTLDGITYNCESEVCMMTINNIYYDAETGVFRSEYYY